MSREIDLRESRPRGLSEARAAEMRRMASEVSDRLPGAHRVRVASFDPMTGSASSLVSESATPEAGDYVRRALEHVQQVSAALGLTAGQPAEFTADPQPQHTSSGAVAVHVQQMLQGIPIFQAAEAVRFSPDGALQETVGTSVAISEEHEVAPSLDPEEAVRTAARHVAEPDPDEEEGTDSFGEPLRMARVDLGGFAPEAVSAFLDRPDQPRTYAAGPFAEPIKVSLVWFPIADELRLAWEVLITMPGFGERYRTLVDAESGEILYCRQLVASVVARARVFRRDGATARETTDCPRLLADYGLPLGGGLPPAFPDSWVAADRTVGNCVEAHLGVAGGSLRGTPAAAGVTFDAADPFGDDQKVLNIFYYNCFMHDFFYLLGFTEASGNFQADNLGRGGRAGDPVDARSHPGPVSGTANMSTPADGQRPIMNMGLVSSTGRHTAFDSTVVFHEYTHGVTNRLVGGPMNERALEQQQSSGMGEGWGDYIACTINDVEVVGAWVVDRPAGIRRFRYDSGFPDGFGALGTGRYTEVHNIGEIWCATLMEINRAIGKTVALQLVIDALKLSPANPSFLDMRDAILAAVDAQLAAGQIDPAERDRRRSALWRVFARFGMGVGARSNGASLGGIVASDEVPAGGTPRTIHEESTPGLAIPDRDPGGVRDTIELDAAGTIARIAVSVDIQHTFIGDLRVGLTPPGGERRLLYRGTGGNAHDLVARWTSDDTAELADLVATPAAGDWQLFVADVFSLDVGTLRRWSLEIELA